MASLEDRILAAHKAGRTVELQRLQALYRNTRVIDSASRGGGRIERCELVEHRPAARRLAARPSRGDVDVLLAEDAYSSLSTLAVFDTRDGTAETGGFLFGVSTGSTVAVLHATGRGERSERGPSWVNLDPWQARSFYRAPVGRVGTWHVHPSGGREPSEADRQSWRAGLARVNEERFEPVYVGLIVTKERGRTWASPHVAGWVVDHSGRLERAPVTVQRLVKEIPCLA